jgi:hypothetical protein
MESDDGSDKISEAEPAAPPTSSTEAIESDDESHKARDTGMTAPLFRFIPSSVSSSLHRKRHRSGSGLGIEPQRKVHVSCCEAYFI